MCGITGFIDLSSNLSSSDLTKMVKELSHRGPDSSGTYINDAGNYRIGLGHSRLSIIETSALGNQPMTQGDLTIVFNGEIYNYHEIRRDLIEQGEDFETNSDTEVILVAFKKWGKDCAKHFHGMWAFAIYDSSINKLFLCRDRLGVKPLVYYKDNNRIIFASELKSLKALDLGFSLNLDAVTSFFELGYISQADCIYNNCIKVNNGSWVTIDSSLSIEHYVYWVGSNQFDQNYKDDLKTMSSTQVRTHVKEKLIKSFNYRTVSDVPFGVFLSGGVDSSLVTAILTKECGHNLNTFTIGFKEASLDETDTARFVSNAFNTNHFEEILTIDKAKDLIFQMPKIYDEPIGDSSILPTYMVSNLASKHVKVSLSADGADELFLGYDRYAKLLGKTRYFPWKTGYAINMLHRILPFNVKIKRELIKKLRYLLAFNVIDGYKSIVSEFGHSNFSRLSLSKVNLVDVEASSKFSDAENLTLFEIYNYLQSDILYKVDQASMANSLESREPFLDHEIIRLALNLPKEFKYDGKQGKSIIKSILSEYLPDNLVYKKKQGFGVPVKQWLRKDLKPLLLDFALKSSLVHQNGTISNYVLKYANGQLKYSDRVWRFLMFELWKSEHNIHHDV